MTKSTTPTGDARASHRRRLRHRRVGRVAGSAVLAIPALFAAVTLTDSARAASQYWDANGNAMGASPGGSVAPGTWGVDSFWNDLADGTGNSNPWTDGNVAVFSAGSDATGAFTVNVSGTQSPAQIVFEEGTVSLSGGQINLGAAGIDVGDGLPLTAIVGSTVAGSLGLTKTNAGILALTSTSNSYTGNTFVNGGTLAILADANLGDAANSLSLDGGTLRTDANLTTARAILLGASNGTVATNGFNVTFAGNVSGAGGLTKIINGTLLLTGANTYSGPTAFNGGIVEAGPNQLGDSGAANTFAFGGGTLRTAASFNTTRAIAVNAAGGTVDTNGFDSTFGGAISGNGSFSKAGNGTLTLTANSSGYTGTINVNTGTLKATDSGVFGVAGTGNLTSATQVSSGATLEITDNVNVPDRVFLSGTGVSNNGAIHYGGAGTATFSGGITLNTNGARLQSDSGTLVLTNSNVFGSGLDINIGGAGNVITTASPSNWNFATAGGHLVKDGSGTLTLGGASSMTGGVIINGGVVSVAVDTTTNGNSANLGAYPATFKSDAVVLNGGTLRSTNVSNGSNFISPNRGIQIGSSGGAVDSPTPGVALIYHSNTTDNTGGIIGLASGATTATLTKVGAGEFRVQGGGTASFAFTQLLVQNGLYRIGSAGSGAQSVETGFGAAPASPTNDAIVLDGGSIGASLGITLNDNRGITVTTNGGTINGSGGTITMPATSQAKLTGSGPLVISGSTGNGFILNAPLSDFSGSIAANGLLNLGSAVNLTVASLSGNNAGRVGVNGQLTFGADNTSTTFSGAVTAAAATGVVTKTGSGTLTINTNPWANSGPTNINGGTIRYGDAATGLGDNSAVSIAAGATLDMANNPDTIGSLNGAGSVVNGAALTVSGNNASPATYSGNYAGSGSLTKNGSGTQNLAGSNTFSAVTNSTGVLGVQSNGALGAGATPLTASGGTVTFLPTGSGTLAAKIANLTIASGAKLDLADDKLITTTPVGTLTGSTYDGVSGMIQSGRNGGGWTGSTGIVTTQSQATSGNFTSIGIATGQQVRALANPTDTATWAGRTITGSDTLVMYTYGGDANLDGKINVDDYGRIDFNVNLGTSGWFNGDFNYDGKINVDDYGIIDFNVGIQGAPFFSAGSPPLALFAESGVSAVPEPAAISIVALASTAMLSRRRRRDR